MDDPFLERLRRGLEPDFAVDGPLGEPSGMGIVVRARDVSLDCWVAIKTIKPELATAVAVERFLREARTLASFAHPNIVRINRYGTTHDGIPYFVMELVEGETLSQRLERGPLPLEVVLRIGRDILSALEAGHERGIIHRDIKPANIFLPPGRALLADFGIVKYLQSRDEVLTKRGESPATPLYASPEQLAGAEVGPATDLWSLAAVLYEALTGRVWSATNPIDDPAAGDWSGVPGRLRGTLQRGLAFAPPDRWPNAASFRRALWVPRQDRWLARIAAASGGTAIVLLVIWLLTRTAVPDVALRPCLPAEPGVRLREVAFDILRHAESVTLAPLRDDGDRSVSMVPRARYEVSCQVRKGADGGLDVALKVGDHEREVAGQPGEVEWDLGQRIALRILEVVAPDAFVAPACKPRSIEAYNAFMRGQAAMRRDDLRIAIGHFEEAVVRDPDYCLAEWRLWLAQRWFRTPTTVTLVSLLARHGGSLAKSDSLMIAAELAPTRARRWALYADAVKRDPWNAVPPLQYGADLMHRGPLDGEPLERGVALLRQARELESQTASIHDQLVWALIRLGNRDSAYAALQELERHARVVRDVHPAVFRLVWHMRFQPLDRPPDLSAAGPVGADQMAQRVRLALSFDLAPYQALIGGRLAGDSAVSFGMRAHGRTARGLAWLALGRPAVGLRELDSAAAPGMREDRVPALQAAQWHLLAASLGIPGAPDSGAAATAARTTLERLIDDSALGGRAAWTLAVEAWQRRDTTAARAWADRIPPRDSALRAIAAAIDSARHAPRRALDRTDRLRGVREEQNGLGEPFARAILHLRRAEWYHAIGERENAARELRWHENSDFIGWLEGPIQSAEVDWVAGAYVRVREAMRRIDDGDIAACADLRRVVDTLWFDVEPGVDSLRRAGQAKAQMCP